MNGPIVLFAVAKDGCVRTILSTLGATVVDVAEVLPNEEPQSSRSLPGEIDNGTVDGFRSSVLRTCSPAHIFFCRWH